MAFPGLYPPKKPRRHWKAKAISIVLLLIGIRLIQQSAFALIWPPTQLEMNRPDRDVLRQTSIVCIPLGTVFCIPAVCWALRLTREAPES